MKLLNFLVSMVRYAPELVYVGPEAKALFGGSCLKRDKIIYTHGKIVNICIVYKLSPALNDFNFALENCWFGAVELTKNADIDKYKYSGYGTGFDVRGTFLYPGGRFGQNVIIFGADMSSSVHASNKTKKYFSS